MRYRCEVETITGIVQLIAANFLRHGFYWYVTGRVPPGKDWAKIDQKLVAKYGVDVSEWERSQRKKRGLANAHYLRCGNWFVLLVSEGHHPIKRKCSDGGELENLKDCRRIPLKVGGYSISYRRSGVTPAGRETPTKWHAHVRIDLPTYKQLKIHFETIAVHRSVENLAKEFAAIPFARYAPVRRQLLNILRATNQKRAQAGYELLPAAVLKLRRVPVKAYKDAGDSKAA